MTAPLPPHTITKVEQSDETGVWTKQTVRYWNEAAVKLAVREALERATDAMHHAGVNTWEDAVLILRAMIEEYKND